MSIGLSQKTTVSGQGEFARQVDAGQLTIQAYGNVLTGTAALYGIAAEELSNHELDTCSDASP